MTNMISFKISGDSATKSRLRSAALDLGVHVLRSGGFLSAAWLACGMIPAAVTPARGVVGSGSISVLARDSDAVVHSARRSGLRYVAALLVSAGGHDDAAAYLGEVADRGNLDSDPS